MTKKRAPALITRRKGTISITPEGRSVIEAMAARGQDQASIAKVLGIHRRSLTRCKDRDEEVADAYQDGHALLADEITHLLLQAGRKGNVIALIWLSKVRLGWIAAEDSQKEAPAPNVVINLPDARSPAEHMKLLEYDPGEQIGETIQRTDVFGPIPKAVVR